MKTNKTLEKIYITPNIDRKWQSEAIDNESIEYTHTDAFIKKAKEAFCKAMCNGKPPRSTCTSLGTCEKYDNFIKFMRGE